MDIVRPNGNEAELIKMAERLGMKSLALYYPDKKGAELQARIFEHQKDTGVKLISAGSRDGHKVINDYKRRNKKTNIVIGISQPLKHAEYKELAAAGVAVCFPFSEILQSGAGRTALLESIMRSIRLCRKHKVKVAIATFAEDPYELRDEKDLRAFYKGLGIVENNP